MKNRAQATIFLIIAMVLVIGAAFFLTYIPDEPITTTNVEVQNFIQSCLQITLEDAALHVGQKGGAYQLKEPYAKTYFTNTSLLFSNNKATYPTVQMLSDSINDFLRAELTSCFNGFSQFPGKSITVSSASADLIISESQITAALTMPTRITQGGIETKMDTYTTTVDVPLGHLADVATRLLLSQEQNPDVIDITLQESFDVRVEHLPAYDNLMITMIESDYLINNQPLRFVYGSRLGGAQ